MKIIRSIRSLCAWRQRLRGRIVFIPTMGALHFGHEQLICAARTLAGSKGTLIVSLFVNPTQFDKKEDFVTYPRKSNTDLLLCKKLGVNAVFMPAAEEIYKNNHSITVEESSLSTSLCGRSRPGHFRGVCTVVAKLFLIIQPTHAIFGEKDWQQLSIIRRMVRDLNFPLQVLGHPTVREPDGLAISSRNIHLSPEERMLAPLLYHALQQAVNFKRSPAAITKHVKNLLKKAPSLCVDYVEAVDAESLQQLKNRKSTGRLIAAVFLGKTRLIDNIPIPPLA